MTNTSDEVPLRTPLRTGLSNGGAMVIDKLMKKHGLNGRDVLAQMQKHGIEISESYLSKIRTGKRPLQDVGIDIREGLRAVFGLSVSEWRELTGLEVPAYLLGDSVTVSSKGGFSHVRYFDVRYCPQMTLRSVPDATLDLFALTAERTIFVKVRPEMYLEKALRDDIPNGSTLIFYGNIVPKDGQVVLLKLMLGNKIVRAVVEYQENNPFFSVQKEHDAPHVVTADDVEYEGVLAYRPMVPELDFIFDRLIDE